MNTRGPFRIVTLALFAVACGAPHLATVERAKADLQGRDSGALACIGEPLEQLPTSTSETTIWRFSSAQPRGDDGRRVRDPGQPPDAHDRACLAEAHVQGDRISAVTTTNRAGWGFGSIEACSSLLAACAVDRRPPV